MKRYATLLLALFVMFLQVLEAQNCLNGWSYRRAVTVNNGMNTDTLHQFQVLLTVNTATAIGLGRMQANGADIRFTTEDCCEDLYYWIESGINTATTNIWIRVPEIPANDSIMLYMNYGNPAAAATSDSLRVFDFFEGFSGPNFKLVNPCGTINTSVSGGNLNYSWTGKGMLMADTIFPQDTVYTAEMDVVNATNRWPSFIWETDTTFFGYSLRIGFGTVRMGAASIPAFDHCRGEFVVSTLYNYTTVSGIWKLTWVATGDIRGSFPSVPSIVSADNQHSRNGDLRLKFGGPATGDGSFTVDWVRVRKWGHPEPVQTPGPEIAITPIQVNLGPDLTICAGDTATLYAGSGTNTYLWSDGSTDSTLEVSQAGTYWVMVSNPSGCPVRDTIEVFLQPAPIVGFTYTSTGMAFSFNDTTNGAVSWSWDFGDGNSSTVMNPNHSYSIPGTYTVCLTATDQNGCSNTYCEQVMAEGVGLSPKWGSMIQLWPNPTDGLLNIEFTMPAFEPLMIRLLDMRGRLISESLMDRSQSQLDLREVPAGMYFISLEAGGKRVIRKVMHKGRF